MTVCIATLYDSGKGCTLISDEMITTHFPIGYEYETEEVEKIIQISKSMPVYALISGDVIIANEIIDDARVAISKNGTSSASGVADALRDSYSSIRRKYIIRQELEPRGLNLNTYYTSHRSLLPELVQIIDNAFKIFNLRVELIVAGQDVAGQDQSLCHIFTIINPGLLNCYDCIGYTAIGSGAPHAIYSLIESDYKKSFDKEKANEAIKRAKERSQVAPGVGAKTKIMPSLT
jgi:20S proteasome alpha/beta subunit